MLLISNTYFDEYNSSIELDSIKISTFLKQRNENLKQEDFYFYAIASSLYSSKIEGNSLDVDSFFNGRGKKNHPKIRDINEIEDLILAYNFAKINKLNFDTILTCHNILSRSFLPKEESGKLRKMQVGIRDRSSMKPVYLAVEPEYLAVEFDKLISDIDFLVNVNLSTKEVFYYASMIHLWIAMIHPFADGNGRVCRLVEKWFLAQKLGNMAWSIPSEKFYWDNRAIYYENISLGYNYYSLFWQRSLPFLLMLSKAFNEYKFNN